MIFKSNNSVDSRVVELKFENQQFEQNAKSSISLLDRLRNALDFSKQKDTFSNIGSGLKSITIGPLAAGLDTVTAKFSALDVVAMRALTNITDSIQSAATGFVKSVTVDQVSAGWEKYADKTSAVQTIMAATAKDFDDTATQMEHVNEQLDKLNWFTDETSYSFLDMVSNIGKFTSNNVDLATSVTAMEGISNWAAISGANVQQASHAMYNLSQAIATGTVKLMDWKSIENANMATAEFKQTAIETAEALGTLKKVGDSEWETLDGKAKVSVSNFNEGLQKGWFTSDVLMKTLSRYGEFTDKLSESLDKLGGDMTATDMLGYIEDYKNGSLDLQEAADATSVSATTLKAALEELSGDEYEFGRKAFKAAQEAKTFTEAIDSVKDAVSTGWMNTFEIMFGDYTQAKTLWTDLANSLWDIFASGGEARNELLKEAFSQQEAINESDWAKLTESGIASPAFVRAVKEAAAEHSNTAKKIRDDEEWLNYALRAGVITATDLGNAYKNMLKTGDVNQSMKEVVTKARDTDESFKELYETLSKYSEEDISEVVFGDHAYTEGAEELEHTLDSLMEKLGFTQDQGEEFVTVLKDMGLFGGLTSKSLAELSDEELKNLGYTQESIDKLHEAIENGEDLDKIIEGIQKEKPSTREMWFDTLHAGMTALVDIFGVAQDAWNEVFPEASADSVTDLISAVHDAVEEFSTWVTESDTLHNAFVGLFSILDVVRTTVMDLISGAMDVLSAIMEGLGINIEDVVNDSSSLVTSFNEWYQSAHPVAVAMNIIAKVANLAARAVRGLFDWFMKIPFVQVTLNNFKVGFKSAFESMPDFIDGLKSKWEEFQNKLEEIGGFNFSNLGDVWELFRSTVLDYISNYEGFKSLKVAFENLKNDLVNIVTEMASDIWGKLEELRESLDGTFAGTVLGTIMDTIKGIYDGITGTTENEGDKAVEGTVDIFSRIQLAFSNFLTFLSSANIVKIGGFLLGLGVIKKIIYFILNTGGILKQSKGVLKNLKTMLKDLGKMFDAKTKATNAEIFMTYAKAIGLLTVCVFALAQLDPGAIWNAVAVLGVLALMLLGIKKLLDIMNGGGETDLSAKGIAERILDNFFGDDGTGGFIKIAVAIGILAAALAVVAKTIEGGNILPALGVIALLVAGMIGVTYALSKIKGSMVKGGLTLVFFAAAVKIMASIVGTLGKLDTGVLAKGVIAVGALGLIMALLTKLLSGEEGAKFGSMVGLMAFALAIKFIAGIVKSLGALDLGTLTKGIAAVGALGLIIAGLSKMVEGDNVSVAQGFATMELTAAIGILTVCAKELAGLDAGGLIQAVVGVGAFALILSMMSNMINGSEGGAAKSLARGLETMELAAAIAIMATCAVELSKLDTFALGAAVTAIGAFGLCLGAITKLLNSDDVAARKSLAKGLETIELAAAIGIITEAATRLAALNPDELGRAEEGLTVISGCLSILTVISDKCSSTTVWSGLDKLATGGSIWAITDAFTKLGKLPVENLRQAEEALAVISLCLAGLMVVSNFLNISATDMGGIGTLAGAVGGLATALAVLAEKDPEKIQAAGFAMSMVMGVFAILMAVTAIAGPVSAKIFILVGVVGALALVLGLLANFTDTKEVLDAALGLTAVMLALSVLMGVLAVIGIAGPAVMAGLAALGILVGVFTLLTGIFAVIQYFTDGGFGEAMQKGIEVMISIGEGIGRFFGAMVAGFAEEAVNALPAIADALVQFMTKLQELNGLTSLNWDALLDALGAVTAVSFTELLTALPNVVTEFATGKTAMEQFAEDIDFLCQALTTWSTSINGMGSIEFDSEGVSTLASTIGELALTEIVDSISTIFTRLTTGKTAIEQFADNIGTLATTLLVWSVYMDLIDGVEIPKDGINDLSDTISEIALDSLITGIEDFGSKLLTGQGTLENFKTNTETLATALTGWQSKMEEIGSVTVPTESIEELTTAIDSVPKTGIFEAIGNFFSGSTKIEDFSENVGYLGDGLKTFADKLGDEFDADTVTAAAGAIGLLGDLGTVLKDQNFGGLFSSSDYSKFGDALDDLSEPLIKFSKLDLDPERLTTISTGAKTVATAAAVVSRIELQDSDLVNTILVGMLKQSVDTLVEALNAAAGASSLSVDNFVSSVEKLASADLSSVESQLNSQGDAMAKAGSNMAADMGSNVAQGLNDQSGSVSDAVGSMTSAAAETVSESTGAFRDKAVALVDAMAFAVSQSSSFKDALNFMVSDAADGIDTNALYNSGVFFVQGFAQGIINTTAEAAGRAAAMARAAMLAVQVAIKQGSPSKVMIESGMWFTTGFALGIERYAYRGKQAAENMAETTVGSMRDAIGAVLDLFNSDMDAEPVITPVMDLSNIRDGASSISSMLSGLRPVSLLNDIDTIRINNANIKQRATSDDLLEALGAIRDTDRTGGDTYNINGITYDDGSNITDAVRTLVRAVVVGGRA